jgi:hypothetical protein
MIFTDISVKTTACANAYLENINRVLKIRKKDFNPREGPLASPSPSQVAYFSRTIMRFVVGGIQTRNLPSPNCSHAENTEPLPVPTGAASRRCTSLMSKNRPWSVPAPQHSPSPATHRSSPPSRPRPGAARRAPRAVTHFHVPHHRVQHCSPCVPCHAKVCKLDRRRGSTLPTAARARTIRPVGSELGAAGHRRNGGY